MSDEIFTNPEYLAECTRIQAKFGEPDADGMMLYKEMQELLIRQGEWNFEQQVKDHPYWVALPDRSELEMVQWIEDRCTEDEFVFQPQAAQGKYKDCFNRVYFRQASQAVLFKLTWA